MSDLENAVARLREWMQATYPQDFELYPDQGSPTDDVQAVLAALAEAQRERDQARWEVALLKADLAKPEWRNVAIQQARDALQARVERLVDALGEYGEHQRECPIANVCASAPGKGWLVRSYRGDKETWHKEMPACTCGLNAALAEKGTP